MLDQRLPRAVSRLRVLDDDHPKELAGLRLVRTAGLGIKDKDMAATDQIPKAGFAQNSASHICPGSFEVLDEVAVNRGAPPH